MTQTTADILAAAEQICDTDGHAAIVDGRCVRCRRYGPIPSEAEREAEHLALMDAYDGLGAPEPCPYYTADQGCPMHGETCQ